MTPSSDAVYPRFHHARVAGRPVGHVQQVLPGAQAGDRRLSGAGLDRDFADPLGTLYATFYGPSITPSGNPNQGQVNVPAINAAMAKAALVVQPAARYQAWANIDKMLVADAAAIPEDYDSQASIEATDVAGVNDLWDEGTWDMAFTSLKNP
jgi:peptide/nickel transport system substrate-binding protein